jgi:hypothetical protein
MTITQKLAQPEEQEQFSQLHAFLSEEYEHASEYSLNTLKDRTQTFNLYVLVLGALSYAFVLIHTGTPNIDVTLFTIGLLIFYGLINMLYFARFVTLGINYSDSIERLDEIRRYYLNHLKPDIKAEIYSKDREFDSPKILRPSNSVVCFVYTLLELASFVVAGILLGNYFQLSILLVACILLIAVFVVSYIQWRYYKKPWFK